MDIDLKVFKIFRSISGQSKTGDLLIKFAATWLFVVFLLGAFLGLAVTALYSRDLALNFFGITLAAVLIAEAVSWAVGIVVRRERPFVHLDLNPLVRRWMVWKKSFPSDHTTIGLTIALLFIFWGIPLGYALLSLAVIVSLARISAGVHYPSDVVAGAILAVGVSLVIAGVALRANL